MKNPFWKHSRVKTLVFCPFDCPLQHVEETTTNLRIAGIIGVVAKIEDLSGPVQISTCQGLDLPDKQAEKSNPRVCLKNKGCLFRKKGALRISVKCGCVARHVS